MRGRGCCFYAVYYRSECCVSLTNIDCNFYKSYWIINYSQGHTDGIKQCYVWTPFHVNFLAFPTARLWKKLIPALQNVSHIPSEIALIADLWRVSRKPHFCLCCWESLSWWLGLSKCAEETWWELVGFLQKCFHHTFFLSHLWSRSKTLFKKY